LIIKNLEYFSYFICILNKIIMKNLIYCQNRRKATIFLKMFMLGILISFAANEGMAQERWNLALRGGVNFPTQDLADASLNNGFGFEGTLSYRFLPSLAVVGGWGWNQFSADRSFAGPNVDFEETGYTLGLQYIMPFPNSNIALVVGGSGIYNHIEIESREGNLISDSEHGLGWQADLGISFPITNWLSFMPGVRYRSLSRDFQINNITTPADLRYFSTNAALVFNF
jgi:hypothetical protein